jgi:hypothetical protein
MIDVVMVSSREERTNAEALAALVRKTWPWIEGSSAERMTIAAGLRIVRETDLLLTFVFDRPRRVGPILCRSGRSWSGDVQAGAIVIEVKAHDCSRLRAIANDLRPHYSGTRLHETVLEQLGNQILGMKHFQQRYSVEHCFVHGLAWMRGATDAELLAGNPHLSESILGSDASFAQMIAAAASAHGSIGEPQTAAYCSGVTFLTERLTREREMSARDLARLDRLTTEVLVRDVVDDMMNHLGTHQVRLVGRAGSGKSTTLALVARRVAVREQARILFLTYQRVLRGELEHLVRTIAQGSGIAAGSIVVETMFDVLLAAFAEFGGSIPAAPDGTIDYVALPAALRTFTAARGIDAIARDAAVLRELDPQRFAFDYVFVDEAQDWRPEERDLLRALFPPERTVLADGLDQFAQRQSRCNWSSDVPHEKRYVRQLNRSLRMSQNVAHFVTAFARAMGHADWSVQPHSELVGGRIIIARPGADRGVLLGHVLEIARAAGISPGDCLVATPPRMGHSRHPAHLEIRGELAEQGFTAWDATDEQTRVLARQPHDVPLVPYGSLRGLEGWATVLVGLDRAYANKLDHPNLEADETATPSHVARNAMLLAVTRAAHVLAITIDDDASPVVPWIEEAARACGNDVVERM